MVTPFIHSISMSEALTRPKAPESIIQLLRDAVYAAPAPLSTTYNSGDHVICVSQSQQITIEAGYELDGFGGSIGLTGSIGEGGICLFLQHMADGATLSLESIRPLMDAILEHGCTTCGSVPIHFVDKGSNDPSDGILTFNYVANPFCVDHRISAVGGSSSSSPSSAGTEEPSATTVFVVIESSTTVESMPRTITSYVTTPTSQTDPDNGAHHVAIPPLITAAIAIGVASILMAI
jgi:hypothetical protein